MMIRIDTRVTYPFVLGYLEFQSILGNSLR
jgi:hypothetical protein